MQVKPFFIVLTMRQGKIKQRWAFQFFGLYHFCGIRFETNVWVKCHCDSAAAAAACVFIFRLMNYKFQSHLLCLIIDTKSHPRDTPMCVRHWVNVHICEGEFVCEWGVCICNYVYWKLPSFLPSSSSITSSNKVFLSFFTLQYTRLH